MSAVTPAKLSEKHRLIAYLDIAGCSGGEIARQLGYTDAWVSTVKSSPLYHVLKDQLRRELREQTIGGVVDRIRDESGASLQVILRLRDHAEDEKVRLSAAKDVLDRNPETAHVAKMEDRRDIRLSLDVTALHLMATADAELDGREPPRLPTFPVLDAEPVAAPANGPLRARTVDEWLAEEHDE